MYLTIFPAAIEIKKRSADDPDESSGARPRYIPPPPPPPPRTSSSSSWEEGSVNAADGPKSWDAPVDGLLSYVLTGKLHRVTNQIGEEEVGAVSRLVDRFCSYLLPKQNDGASQITICNPFSNLIDHPVYCVCGVKFHLQFLLSGDPELYQ